MTYPLTHAPASAIPFDPDRLEREVVEMERTLDLLQRREAAMLALAVKGIADPFDGLKPTEMIRLVAARRGLTSEEIRRRCPKQVYAQARHEVFYLLSIQVKRDGTTRWSLPRIGQMVAAIGDKPYDHTTVLHGIRQHEERLRAYAAGERPKARLTGPRPGGPRIVHEKAGEAGPAMVCMLPIEAMCIGCGAPAGEPCLIGARRG